MIDIVLEMIISAIRHEKEKAVIYMLEESEAIYISLSIKCLYRKSDEMSKNLEQIRGFSKVAEYRIRIQRIMYF